MLFVIGISLIVLLLILFLFNKFMVKRAERRYPPTGKFVTVEGVKLHYYTKGSGKPAVFLHGGVLTGQDFAQVLELAAQKGYRAIAFDRPGYGYSERPKKEKVTPRMQARLIHGALRKLGIDKPIIVAHSWSGVMALTYVLDYPDDLSGLLTLGGGMYKKEYPAINGDIISKLVTTPVLGSLLLHTILVPLGFLLAGSMIRATFAPEAVPPEYAHATRALWFRPSQFRANREDVLAFVPACDHISERYKEIKVPTVIMVGAEDPFSTKVHSEWLNNDIPHSKLLICPNIAHMIPQNHPHTVMEGIEQLTKQAVESRSS